MYYYFNRPKMSASRASKRVGERSGAARLHSGSRIGERGGGCGELVNGDAGSSSAAATATSSTPAQCCDRESSVAEAQAYSEQCDDATCVSDADSTGRKKKKKNDGDDGLFFVNGAADIAREGGECADSGKYGLVRCGSAAAAGRQSSSSAGPGEDNGINIDYEPGGSQHGGEPRCFMDAASRKRGSKCRASQPQPTGTGRNNRKEGRPLSQVEETEGATVRAAAASSARCGHREPEPVAVSKRRGCSFTRASKRVCFAGTSTVAYCGSEAGARVSLGDGVAPVKTTAGDTSVLLKSCGRTENSLTPGCREEEDEDAPVGRPRAPSRHRVRGESVTGCSGKFDSTSCPRGGVGNIMNRPDGPPCSGTAKGRVRLYRVRSFLTSASDHHNGVSGVNGNDDVSHSGNSGNPTPPHPCPSVREQQQLKRQRGRENPAASQRAFTHKGWPPAGSFIQAQNGSLAAGAHTGTVSIQGSINGEGRCEGPELGQGPTTEQVEGVSVEAARRQAELEERTEKLWRRLQAVQVKQVERHVTQQLRGLRGRASGWSCARTHTHSHTCAQRRPAATPRSSADLSSLARSCSEVLRATGGALDSDHTASSSGGGSESEEEEEEQLGRGRGGRTVLLPATTTRMGREWQWVEKRAWLGSRWVWLQAQVSELEYRIRALTELYTHLRQGKMRSAPSQSVPDTALRAPRPPPSPHGTTCRSSTCDPLRKRPVEDSSPSPQTPPTPPASAARVQPLPRQRRHRLIRLEGSAALGSKAVTLPCWCELPAVCVLCGGAPPRPPSHRDECVWVRRSRLDVCVHPVLSLPSDSPLAVHCGIPPLVGLCSHNALRQLGMSAPPPWLGRRGQGAQRAGRAKRRLVCPRPPNTLPPLLHSAGGSGSRSQRGVVSAAFLSQRITDLPSLMATPLAPDTPTQPLRRRRGESSFDIDNLVMPLGLAGLGARVQKLQYKEIITPSWRELDSGVSEEGAEQGHGPLNPTHTEIPPTDEGPEEPDSEEVEDLLDEVFLSRHALCESRERSRWGSLALRRRRGRSSYHGEGKLSSRLDHAPCSPDPRQGVSVDGESSPCSPLMAPDTPSTAEEPCFYQPEEELQAVLPWERRSFPLLEAELHWLEEEEEPEEEEDPCAASGRSQSTDSGISLGSLELSPRTPQPTGTELATPHPLARTPQPAGTELATPHPLARTPQPAGTELATPHPLARTPQPTGTELATPHPIAPKPVTPVTPAAPITATTQDALPPPTSRVPGNPL